MLETAKVTELHHTETQNVSEDM